MRGRRKIRDYWGSSAKSTGTSEHADVDILEEIAEEPTFQGDRNKLLQKLAWHRSAIGRDKGAIYFLG